MKTTPFRMVFIIRDNMNIWTHQLWQLFMQKNRETNDEHAAEFESDVRLVCQHGIDQSKTISDTFHTYTLHDDTHICNVMSKMLELLGKARSELTRDECAMLMMAACCHDIGMSATAEEKEYLRNCPDCMQTYLESHPSDYSAAYANGPSETPNITDEILQHYIRANHHNRVYDQLQNIKWPTALAQSISVEEVIAVCQSHGENPEDIQKLQNFASDLDLHLCAVVLRLADILDFDATRAPDALYRYNNLAQLDGVENEQSLLEWKKHRESCGFTLTLDETQKIPILLYRAECTAIQVEKAIIDYLNWIDTELAACTGQIRYMDMRWRHLLFPSKIKRHIVSKGYLSGEYKLTIDQDQTIKLLIGKELYSNPAIFVRELIQNAIDAVRTRKQLDKNLPQDWKPQINIKTWTDQDSYWFRIEDNGIGMTEDMIQKYFLKIGHSYYNSDQFQADKIRYGANFNYKPISCFGIGLLSCFMGDSKNSQVEVTTKHFPENGVRYPAYRLSIQGVNGFYFLANDIRHRLTAPDMPKDGKHSEKFIAKPGTVIAVRTKLFQTGGVLSFKNIIDKYVVYPEVPIHYEGIEGSYDYKTEQEFMDDVHRLAPKSAEHIYQLVEQIPLSEAQLWTIQQDYPELVWRIPPKISIFCVPLDYVMETPLIKGVSMIIKVDGEGIWQAKGLDEKYVPQVKLLPVVFSNTSSGVPSESVGIHISFQLPNESRRDLEQHILPAIQANLRLAGSDIKFNDFPSYDLSQIISRISFDDIQGVSREEFRAFHASLATSYSARFSLMLEQYDWYREWFNGRFNGQLHIAANSYSCNAHNGILADSSNQLLPFSDAVATYTILLLKDKYCPRLNLSRDLIQSLPLAAVCNLEALVQRMQDILKISDEPNIFSAIRFVNNYYHTDAFHLIPLKDYFAVLEQGHSLFDQLRFSTELGDLFISDISDALHNRNHIELTSTPKRSFFTAVLLWYFDLKILSFSCLEDCFGSRVCITKKSDASVFNALTPFPPALFLPSATGDITVLACHVSTNSNFHPPYNAEHPFSQWLISNQATLQREVPGIYHKMITQLLHGSGIINNINEILSQLRKIPHLEIAIAKDLTEKDFEYLI